MTPDFSRPNNLGDVIWNGNFAKALYGECVCVEGDFPKFGQILLDNVLHDKQRLKPTAKLLQFCCGCPMRHKSQWKLTSNCRNENWSRDNYRFQYHPKSHPLPLHVPLTRRYFLCVSDCFNLSVIVSRTTKKLRSAASSRYYGKTKSALRFHLL